MVASVVCSHVPVVAPHAGAGIEIDTVEYYVTALLVAPHAGAGIEI